MIYHYTEFRYEGIFLHRRNFTDNRCGEDASGEIAKKRLPSWILSRLTARPRPRGDRKEC